MSLRNAALDVCAENLYHINKLVGEFNVNENLTKALVLAKKLKNVAFVCIVGCACMRVKWACVCVFLFSDEWIPTRFSSEFQVVKESYVYYFQLRPKQPQQ